MYQTIRPFMTRERALEIGFSEEELDSDYPPIVTDARQYDNAELDFFQRMVNSGTIPVSESIKQILNERNNNGSTTQII